MSAGAKNSRPGHEESDAHPRFVGLIAGALAALVAAGLLVGWGFVAAGRGDLSTSRIVSTFQDGPKARTGVDRAWEECEHDVRGHLSGYEWVDRSAGIVTVPIDRAIDLVCADEARKSSAQVGKHPAP